MAHKNPRTVNELLIHLKADLEQTLADYDKATQLRAKKMIRETEQIRTYIELLENKQDTTDLNSRSLRKLNKILVWQKKPGKKDLTQRKQQDRLEDHFQELQKVLVGLLSRRFKY
jgi:hypothetical protein